MKFIVFTGGEKNELFDLIFADLKQMNNVTLESRIPQIPKALQGLWKLHHAKSLNKKSLMPFRSLWNRFSPLYNFIPDEKEEYCFIFNNVSISYFEPSMLNALKNKYKIHLVMYFLDSFKSYYSSKARMCLDQIDFDLVYTFHKPDEIVGKIEYFDCYYSKQILEILKNNPNLGEGIEKVNGLKTINNCNELKDKKDFFFWGVDSGRGSKIEELYEILTNVGFSAEFGICYSDDKRNKKAGIVYNKPLPYPEIIKHVKNAECIVDIVGEYSGGISLRAYEAVTYGKKLLTDNPLVKNMRFYNPEMMQIFSDPNEIDFDFFKHKNENDNPYEYTDEYSPIHFIERIEKELAEVHKTNE